MKILHIFGFFVTVGSLGFTVAATSQFGAEDGRFKHFHRIFEETCKKNGGPKAFEAYLNSSKRVKECTSNVMMELQKMIDKTVQSSGKIDSYLPLVCTKAPALKGCIEPQFHSMQSCADQETKKLNDDAYKILNRFVDFTCNNTEKFKKLTIDGVDKCLASKLKDLLVCAEDILGSIAAAFVKQSIRHMHGGQETVLPKEFGKGCSEEHCSMIEWSQTCSVKVLNECEDKSTAELLDSLFKFINPDIPCKNLIKSHHSQAI